MEQGIKLEDYAQMATITDAKAPESAVVDAHEQRLRVLKDLDDRPFGWFHMKAVLVSGVGFFTDSYDVFIINLVVPMLGYVYWMDHKNKVPTNDSVMIKGAATIGTFLGQLLFGFLGDFLGRKKIYGTELLIMILATICTSMACKTEAGVSVTFMLALWRLLLGVGIGGDYPLSAVLTSEYASKKRRGMMIAMVFSMQGIGVLFAGIVSVVLLLIFKDLIEQDQKYVDHVWRLCLLCGILPASAALYFRTRVPESPRYTLEVERNAAAAESAVRQTYGEVVAKPEAASPSAPGKSFSHGKLTWAEFRDHFKQWRNMKVLLGASLSWFFLDIAWYGLGLNQSIVLKAIGFSSSSSSSPYKALFALASGNALISIMGTVPGYFVTVALVERWGRKPIQLMGFAALTIIFVVLSAAYHPLVNHHKWLFCVLYCVGQFFFNFGPNTTTFIVPGEVFPTRMRSTGHGICAAAGKLGAIIAAYGFQPIVDNEKKYGYTGVQVILAIFSVVMFLGLLSTFLVPETKGISLEELGSGEDEASRKLKQSPAVSPAQSPAASPHGSPRLTATTPDYS